MKLLLHACCGPCSLEPVRALHAAGHDLTIYFANANIAPYPEYVQRRSTLKAWAATEGVAVLEGAYEPDSWEQTAGRIGQAALDEAGGNIQTCALDASRREARCQACYRLRFEETARYAATHAFDGIGTTLSVSPYQFTDIIQEELERAAANNDVEALFEDYRPLYDEATRRSREANMYRQNYCGCRFSDAEAAVERSLRKQERAAAREAQAQARAREHAAAEELRAQTHAEKQAFAEKQARKRAVLKALRAQNKTASSPHSPE